MLRNILKKLMKDEVDRDKDGNPLEEDSQREPLLPKESKGRGRPAGALSAVNYWSRIISLNHGPMDLDAKYSIDDDLEEEQKSQNAEEFAAELGEWPHFEAKHWILTHGEPHLWYYSIPKEKMDEYA